jgi:hypothetical protein
MAGDPEPTESDEDTLVIPSTATRQNTLHQLAVAACLFLYAAYATLRENPGPWRWYDLIFFVGLYISIVVSAIFWSYPLLVRGYKPIVFDRRTDQLRHGNKVHCRLSEIRQVQITHFSHDTGAYYSPEIVLADSRRVNLGPFINFPSEDMPAFLKREIETFLKLPISELTKPSNKAKSSDPASSFGLGDWELDG